MRRLVGILLLVVWLFATPTVVMAEMETLSVKVSFRERIALPPDAQLEVWIHEIAETDMQGDPIAFQRFAMTAVPMTVSLNYDAQVVDARSRYAVFSAIRAPDGQQVFRATRTLETLGGVDQTPVEILLMMRPDTRAASAVPRRISGVPWVVTEVFGEAWQNDDPATLVIDDQMNFAIFGGCNRFSGQLASSSFGLSFPENTVGTMMACPDEVEALERRFLAALMQVSEYVRYGAGLVLMDSDGRAVLHFAQAPK